MDALELLKNWPTWQKAGAEQLFDSPAWRLPITYDGEPCDLIKAEFRMEDPLWVMLTFDGEVGGLGIGDTSAFPDLHRLWPRRGQLPKELLLALVEQECGALLQMLEDATQKLVSVTGIATESKAECTAFCFTRRDGTAISFSLSLSPVLLTRLGRFENLDLRHPWIRGLSRSARGVYAELSVDVTAHLGVGDMLVLPPDEGARSTWMETVPDDGRLRICTPEEGTLTFAQLADDSLPEVPTSETVLVMVGANAVAMGRLAPLGQCRAVSLTSMLSDIR